jgi:hypothetical protein
VAHPLPSLKLSTCSAVFARAAPFPVLPMKNTKIADRLNIRAPQVDGTNSRRCLIPGCSAELKPPPSLKNKVYERLIAEQFNRKHESNSSLRHLPVICTDCYRQMEGLHKEEQIRSTGLFVLVYIASDADRVQLESELKSRGEVCNLQTAMPFTMDNPGGWWHKNSFIKVAPVCIEFSQFSTFGDILFAIQPSWAPDNLLPSAPETQSSQSGVVKDGDRSARNSHISSTTAAKHAFSNDHIAAVSPSINVVENALRTKLLCSVDWQSERQGI